MPFYKRVILYFDGASRNNPSGPAGCGWVLYEMDQCGAEVSRIDEERVYLGYGVSNNQAEYEGLVTGLEYIRDNIDCDRLYIRGDSEIVIRQMEGEYQVRSPNIQPYYENAKDALNGINCCYYTFKHISRDRNSEADQLANDAIAENRY